MTEPLIEIAGVSKRYRFFQLDDVALRLEAGQIMGFVGPNGAGKSTTIRILLGMIRAERGDVHGLRRWFTITFVMGLIFVLGQLYEYRTLIGEGVKINADGYGSMFYLTTGFHGLHVTGGLIAFILFMIRTTLGRFTPAQATAAIVVSYYWHFVDLVWIALFAMIYLLQ